MKMLAILLAVAVGILAIAGSYRTYRVNAERQLAAQRAAAEEREAERAHRVAAEEEARRLAALQAEQQAAEAERQIATLKAEQAAADTERQAKESEAARWQAELDRLTKEKEAASTDAMNASAQRLADIARIERAHADALAKVKSLEEQKTELHDRQAAREAALAHQQELEKKAQEELARFRARSQP